MPSDHADAAAFDDELDHDEQDVEHAVTWLDEDSRRSRLAFRVAQLVQRGGIVEHVHGMRAVVLVHQPQQYLPSVVLALASVAMFLWVGGAFFLLAGGVALLGWHRKLMEGTKRVRLLLRVDDDGVVNETPLEVAA